MSQCLAPILQPENSARDPDQSLCRFQGPGRLDCLTHQRLGGACSRRLEGRHIPLAELLEHRVDRFKGLVDLLALFGA